MKVIFLDHFGVMCLSNKSCVERNINDNPPIDHMRVFGDFDDFDLNCIETLNDILLKTDAEIIISSDWKKWSTIEQMKGFYNSQGIIKPPIGFTPNISSNSFYDQREKEISYYLINNPKITNWVAIDDIYLPNLSNFIWISRIDKGISQEGVKEKILYYLSINDGM